MRLCDMNRICRTKHAAVFLGTLDVSSSIGLELCLLLSLLLGLCLSVSLPVTMYLPVGMEGKIYCPEEANPPLSYIIWKKNEKIVGEQSRIAINDRGTLLIRSVIASDEGNYTCTPYSPLLNVFSSFPVRIIVKDLPSFTIRPLPVYQRRVGQSVVMPCVANGDPKPAVSWKKADGPFPPTTKTLQDGGNLTIVQLSEEEQGTYECIAKNIVMTIITTTLLIVQPNFHSSPYNVTVEVSESTARISWLPPYIDEGQSYDYELWCLSPDEGPGTWQRFDAIPDNVTTVTVYNLQPGTYYKFKVMSSYSGKPHFSREMVVRTKFKNLPTVTVWNTDDEGLNSGDYSSSTYPPPEPSPGYRPMPPFNVSVQQLRNGVNISWAASRRSPVPVEYYVVQYQTFGQWVPLSGKIDGGQTHYVWTVPSLGPTYQFRVLSYGQDSQSRPSSAVTFLKADPLKENERGSSAALGGLIGGVVCFVLLVVLLLAAFKAYRIKEKKKREMAFAPVEYASTSINRTLEGRASPILETLSIISNHSQIKNNDHEMRPCHETPI